jgi:hypothetical protein
MTAGTRIYMPICAPASPARGSGPYVRVKSDEPRQRRLELLSAAVLIVLMYAGVFSGSCFGKRSTWVPM